MLPLHEAELIYRVRASYEVVPELGGYTTHSDKYLLNVISDGVFLVPRATAGDTSLDVEGTSKPMMGKADSGQRTLKVCQLSPILNLLPVNLRFSSPTHLFPKDTTSTHLSLSRTTTNDFDLHVMRQATIQNRPVMFFRHIRYSCLN